MLRKLALLASLSALAACAGRPAPTARSASPLAGLVCPGGGDYCGSDGVSGGDPSTLYHCPSAGQPPFAADYCPNGCHVMPEGVPDYCQSSPSQIGIDMNRPISGGATNMAAVQAVQGTGVRWVRVNFTRDIWSGPTDSTPRGPSGLTWFQAFDNLINAYAALGTQVYGLLGAESTSATGPQDGDAYQTQFVTDAHAIVEHFRDRVTVYEIYNEPNNWVAPGTPALNGSAFAHLLVRAYQGIKIAHAADPSWQVTLVSGPILSLDVTTGADYLHETYRAGRAQWGWDAFLAANGTYPLDGVGYHIYVAQGGNETAATVSAAVTRNMNAFWQAVSAEEGQGTQKGVYISEIGWRTGAVSPQQQADFMDAGFAALDASARTPIAIWFSLQDFGGNDQWGIYTGQPYDAAHAKPSAARLTAIAATH